MKSESLESVPAEVRPPIHRPGRLLWIAAFGALLQWLCFPPLGLWYVGWLAVAPWIHLIRVPSLAGRRPYLTLYLVGVLLWLTMLQWLRLPHWMTYFGWLALSAYLGVYLPLFVSLSRLLVHECRWPIVVVAPVVWTGLEWMRGRLFSGFSMLLLGNSQVVQPELIQIAELAGSYAVGFVMVLVAACCESSWNALWSSCGHTGARRRLGLSVTIPLVCGFLAVASVWMYGIARLRRLSGGPISSVASESNQPHIRVGLVQGSIDTTFDDDSHPSVAHPRYYALSRAARQADPTLQLLIWPESMYWQYNEPFSLPQGTSTETLSEEQYLHAIAKNGALTARTTARGLGCHLLVGCSEIDENAGRIDRYNSVLAISRDGTLLGRYDKMHPVMFGEYIPLGRFLPWLYKLSPMGSGLTAGTTARSFEFEGIRFAPNICFENTVPHLIRRQVRELERDGLRPDVLVTATNDGWFWGSSLLDHHLACGVMRAVEMRRPLLIAANTGFSAWIDAQGRIRQQGPRRAEGIVVANISKSPVIQTSYLQYGDTPAGACLLACLLGPGRRIVRRRRPSVRHNP